MTANHGGERTGEQAGAVASVRAAGSAGASDSPALQLRQGDETVLAVPAGIVHAVLGPRSATERFIAGLTGSGGSALAPLRPGRPGETLLVDGRPVRPTSRSASSAAGIAVVTGGRAVSWAQSVGDNVLLGNERGAGLLDGLARLLGRRPASGTHLSDTERAARALGLVGLDRAQAEPASGLTALERRLLELARAVAAEASVIVVDDTGAALARPDRDRWRQALAAVTAAERPEGGRPAVLLVTGSVTGLATLVHAVTILAGSTSAPPTRTIELVSADLVSADLVSADLASADLASSDLASTDPASTADERTVLRALAASFGVDEARAEEAGVDAVGTNGAGTDGAGTDGAGTDGAGTDGGSSAAAGTSRPRIIGSGSDGAGSGDPHERPTSDPADSSRTTPGHRGLAVEGWSASHPADAERTVVDHLSFTCAPGEVLGLFGPPDSGAGEVLLSIFGRSYGASVSGSVLVDGEVVDVSTADRARAAGVLYTTEHPIRFDLSFLGGVPSSVSPESLTRLVSTGVADPRRDYEATTVPSGLVAAIPGAHRGPSAEQFTDSLRMLQDAPARVVLLAEPFGDAGDAASVARRRALIRALAGSGRSVVVSSEDPRALAAVCDRVVAVSGGRVAGVTGAAPTTLAVVEAMGGLV